MNEKLKAERDTRPSLHNLRALCELLGFLPNELGFDDKEKNT
jgi:hypothetical protein